MTKIYLSSPHRLVKTNETIADALRAVGNTVYLPKKFCKSKNYEETRHKCIEAIEDSDVFVMYLDDYGMDSAWELGYAEKAGKKIIGLSLDSNKLNTPKAPKPQTIWNHWMHGWKENMIIKEIEELYPYAKSRKVYLSIPVRYKREISVISNKLKRYVDKIYTPTNIINTEIRQLPKEAWYQYRHKCIEAIEDSDVFVMYLDDYGMDSAWELGYAEKAGKKIIGLNLDSNKLNTPKALKPQTIWNHWMHGWKEHMIIHNIYNLIKVLDSSEKFQIPVICPIIERYDNGQIEILVQTRTNPSDKKYWGVMEVPGGKIQKNETIIEALKREVREECGLEIEPVSPKPKDAYKLYGSTATLFESFAITEEIGDHSYIGIFVRCKVVGGHLKATAEGKNQKWVSIDELENLITKKTVLPINAPGLIKYVKSVRNMRI